MSLKNLTIRNNILAYDTETTGLNPWGDFKRWGFYPARPFEFTFCDVDGNTADIRWEVDPFTRRVKYIKKDVKAIREILEDPSISLIGHNLGYDLRMSEMIGIYPVGEFHDTLPLTHVCTGGDFLQYGLKYLGVKLLEYEDTDEKELRASAIKERNKGKKLGWCIATKETHGKDPIKADYWMANPRVCSKYGVGDSERTMLLWLFWQETLKENPDFLEVYSREMRLFNVLRKMENRGVRVIPSELKSLSKFYVEYQRRQQKIADKHGGKGLNFKSPKQMIETFCLKKKYKPIYWGDELKKSKPFYPQLDKKRNPKINGDFLRIVAETKKDKLAKAVLEFRGAKHMIDGFLIPYEKFRTKEDGIWILRTNYKQVGTVTGRLSAGDPNLMQVASETTGRRKTEIALRPREAFSPREGYIWYLPDYSQIEVWVFSFLAQEKAMMDALRRGEDFHGAIAEAVWGQEKDYKERKPYYRKRAKLLMFCKLYGGGTSKVAYLLECSIEEAKQFVYDFDTRLPGVQMFMKKMINRIEREGKIVNPLGRTYFLDSRFSYRAVNYLVQGTSADILKNAMIRVDKLLSRRWKGSNLLLTLHDELIIEVPLKYHSKKLMREIVYEMQRDSKKVGIPVPLPVGMKIAKHRWAKTKEVDSILDEWKDKYVWKN